jgi:hypothetical protein
VRTISESDWRLFRQLRPIALERFCQRVLSEIEGLARDDVKTSHERYLAIYSLIQRRDGELADILNDQRRSTAIEQLVCMWASTLLTEKEMASFSPNTREVVRFLTGR